MRKFIYTCAILCALQSAPSAFAQVSSVNGIPCHEWSTDQFLAEIPGYEPLMSQLADRYWYFSRMIRRDVRALRFCVTTAEDLPIVPDREGPFVSPANRRTVAIRRDSAVLVSLPRLRALSSDHRSYLPLHEALHAYVSRYAGSSGMSHGSRVRNLVNQVRALVQDSIVLPDFLAQMEMNEVSFPHRGAEWLQSHRAQIETLLQPAIDFRVAYQTRRSLIGSQSMGFVPADLAADDKSTLERDPFYWIGSLIGSVQAAPQAYRPGSSLCTSWPNYRQQSDYLISQGQAADALELTGVRLQVVPEGNAAAYPAQRVSTLWRAILAMDDDWIRGHSCGRSILQYVLSLPGVDWNARLPGEAGINGGVPWANGYNPLLLSVRARRSLWVETLLGRTEVSRRITLGHRPWSAECQPNGHSPWAKARQDTLMGMLELGSCEPSQADSQNPDNDSIYFYAGSGGGSIPLWGLDRWNDWTQATRRVLNGRGL